MSLLPRMRSWLRALVRGRDLNREIGDELTFHVDRYAEDLQRQGLSPAEARRRARAELGGLDARREECRQSLGLRLLDELRSDVRYTFRTLRRSPGFTAIAVLSLALGIGANTALFGLVDALLLKSLPVHEPERLYFVDNSGGKSEGSNAPPYPCYEVFRDHSRHFSGLAMFDTARTRAAIDGPEELLAVQYASGNYFNVLGVRPFIGRMLTPADDAPGGGGGPDGPVAVISHRLWRDRFGASMAVLGRQIHIGPTPMTIVGVTPPEFFGLTVGQPLDVTVPVTLSGRNLSQRQAWWLSVVGRLAPGTPVEAARAELDGMFQTYMTETMGRPPRPTDYFNRIELVPALRGLHRLRNQFSTPLMIAMAIVGVVLIIGCANVANLLLARASARQDEMTLRLAIGAGRGRLIRQLLTEGLVLASLGALAGLLLAHWATAWLVAVMREQIVLDSRLDVRLLGFASVVAILTALLCSVAPALGATRAAPAHMASAGRSSIARPRRRMSQALVVVQVTLSLVLLAGAALFIRTLINLEDLDAGFRADGVLTVPAEAVIVEPPGMTDPMVAKADVGRMWEEIARRVGAIPGVQRAAVATLTPIDGRDRGVNAAVVGGPTLSEEQRGIHLNHVSTGFFETFGIDILAGRGFEASDARAGWQPAILNETAAREYFGGASPLGRSLTFNPRSGEFVVVGVVRDVRYESLRAAPERMVYLPLSHPLDAIDGASVAVRGEAGLGGLVPAIQGEIRRTLPSGFAGTATTLDQRLSSALLQERLLSTLAALFGALALALACIGLYGLLSYGVVRRTREFGIRMAIGAPRAAVTWLVLRETVSMLAAGLFCGLILVFWVSRYVSTVLFGVSPRDPLAIGAAVGLLAVIAMTAAYLPARRASRINPTLALRQE